MESILLVIHLIVAIGIITLVLLQPSENDGFMGTGSMSNLMMARRGGDALSRATGILATLFFITSLFLAIAASKRPAVKSILDDGTAAPATQSITLKTTQTAPAAAKEQESKTENKAVEPSVVKKEAAPEKAASENKTPENKTGVKKTEKAAKTEKAEKTPKAPIAK